MHQIQDFNHHSKNLKDKINQVQENITIQVKQHGPKGHTISYSQKYEKYEDIFEEIHNFYYIFCKFFKLINQFYYSLYPFLL